jgi:subtilisin family serine protease
MGYDGTGIVVGIIDTGFAPHPAINEKYRGYQGSPTTFKNNYNWYDTAADPAGDKCKTAPCDDNGHGTHVAGTVVGRAGNDDIGVAPGAQFIACRALKNGSGAISSLLGCYQWFMAPTDLNNQNADPASRPQIVSQSLGAGSLSVAMADAITAMDAAGILSVAAAGNNGNGCKRVSYPAGLSEVLAVGALKADSDTVSDYSSSGPAPNFPNMIKPEIVAQGDAVRSAWLNNQYRAISGTSMATPAVSGVAALVMSASPRWIGHPADVARLLRETANANVSVGLHQSCSSGYPNMVFGYGLVDAYKAVLEASKPPARAQ